MEEMIDDTARLRRENVALHMILADAREARKRLGWAGVQLAIVSLACGVALGWVAK